MEDYSRARVLARIEHMGETFTVVRERVNGKPWRKYLVLLHELAPMARAVDRSRAELEAVGYAVIHPVEAAVYFEGLLRHTFTDKDYLAECLAAQHDRAARGIAY